MKMKSTLDHDMPHRRETFEWKEEGHHTEKKGKGKEWRSTNTKWYTFFVRGSLFFFPFFFVCCFVPHRTRLTSNPCDTQQSNNVQPIFTEHCPHQHYNQLPTLAFRIEDTKIIIFISPFNKTYCAVHKLSLFV